MVVSQDTPHCQVFGIVAMASALVDTMCVMASMTVSMAEMKLIVVSRNPWTFHLVNCMHVCSYINLHAVPWQWTYTFCVTESSSACRALNDYSMYRDICCTQNTKFNTFFSMHVTQIHSHRPLTCRHL